MRTPTSPRRMLPNCSKMRAAVEFSFGGEVVDESVEASYSSSLGTTATCCASEAVSPEPGRATVPNPVPVDAEAFRRDRNAATRARLA